MTKRYANRPTFPFLSDLKIDLEAESKLSINLANVYSGSSTVIESPICREGNGNRILSDWNKVFSDNSNSMNKTLLNLEESQKSKFGPRSLATKWSVRREGTRLYFEQTNIDYSTLDATPQALRDRGILRPLSIANAAKFLKNSTNSGLPFYAKKGMVKDRVLARFEHYLSRKDPCVLFTRTQESMKTRDVWGFPIVDTLNEMRFYRPLLEYQKKLHWRTSLKGPEEVSKRITYIINQAMLSNLDLISVDFSNYDRSIKRDLQLKIAKYYEYLFQDKHLDDLKYIVDRKSTIGLITPDGVYSGPHGEPSGSTFTNEDDSIAQYIISKKSGVTVRDLFDIQGDDGVYAIVHDKVVSLFSTFKRYGLDLNEDKSYISKDYVIYLQNLYHKDYEKNGVIGGIYPTYRALNRILYQERWSNFEEFGLTGKDYFAIRTISILENCKHHPLFKELVTLIVNNDKYGLRPTQMGIRQYIKMVSETSGIEGIIVNQFGDNIKGINSFETVKLIKKLNKA